MLDMFNVGDTSLILLFILGCITVYYIVTDETSKIARPEKKEKPVNIQATEEVKETKETKETKENKEQHKDVERKQNTSDSNINSNIMEQTDDYRPTHSAPLPKIKTVTTTTEYYVEDVQQPVNKVADFKEEEKELQLSDFESDEVEVQCKWCDSIIKAKKGTSIVCPNCSGTVEV